MEKKGMLVLTILMMLIGFAAISTTLIINGSVKVGENTDDFSVIFTSTSLDGTDVYKNVISEDKKTITYTTSELKTLNQTSVLNYEVTNNSANYDAEVQVNCKVKDNVEAKYTNIKNELENNATKVLSENSVNGTLTVTLNKTAIEEVREEYVCELTFNAIERDTLSGYNGVKEWTFDYTDGEQIFTIPVTGTYKLETWGASGGDNLSYKGGYGGYSSGTIKLSITDKIFINIGGKGLIDKIVDNGYLKGGYNGGGGSNIIDSVSLPDRYQLGSGGGATHIAISSGLLSTFENKISELLIVSGGGGGSMEYYNSSQYNSYGTGVSGGGYIGGSAFGYYWGTGNKSVVGGAQEPTTGLESSQHAGSFGQGYDNVSTPGVGGGGGFYGGNSQQSIGGSGGSGYIGNTLLTDKSMYCYNCTESTEESTKTISTTCVSKTPTENCAKIGNGYAKITLIK